MISDFVSDAADAQLSAAAPDRDSWLEKIEEIGEDLGYFQPVGARHWAFFNDQSPVLLVTFETVASIRDGHDSQMPLGHRLAQGKGWSHLCLIAEGETWYRDPAVYRYFDRLVDDAFFEDFDRVVFLGSGMGAYAACAFSVAAAGATVLALRPAATLDPEMAVWDTRSPAARRLSFTDRYGYAPDMIDGAGEVFVIYDPRETLDAMHAALFRRANATRLHCRHIGTAIEQALLRTDVLRQLVDAAMAGAPVAPLFRQIWRIRRRYSPYLRHILEANDGHLRRQAMICRSVTRRIDAPRFRKRLAQLEAQLNLLAAPGPARAPAPADTTASTAIRDGE